MTNHSTASRLNNNYENVIEIIEGDLADLKNVYHMYEEDFPIDERKDYEQLKILMMKKRYKLLLAKHKGLKQIFGYAFIYVIGELNTIWLDYFAIVEGFRNSGYGTLFISKIAETRQCNIFIEVGIPEGLNTDIQYRRISFYERLGAKKVDIHYELPTDQGGLPMYLYFKPSLNGRGLDMKYLEEVIFSTFGYIHSDVKNNEVILNKCIASIHENFQ